MKNSIIQKQEQEVKYVNLKCDYIPYIVLGGIKYINTNCKGVVDND